eukprot:Em0004g1619a
MASREELEEQIRVLQRQLALQISSDDRSNGSTAIPSSTNIQVDANPQVPLKSTAVISLPSPVVSVTLKANQLTQQSFGPAFDLCKSAQDLKILHLVPPPGLLDGDNWLSESDVDKEVSLQGIMYNYRLEKGRIKADTESASKACAIVMECGVGSSAFQTILNTLKECDKNEENMMLAKDPEVYSVQGFPITFPTFLNAHHRDKSSIQHLTSYFSDAWFHSDLSHIEAVSQHIAAYRTSGHGGIIYIGLKLTKKDDGYDIQKNAIVLTVEQLSALKTQIQNFCKDQCPSCSAVEWTQKALPPDAKQRRDECLYTIFTSGPVKSPRQCRYVFRLVVFPSRELLHLCKESDIGFRKKNGSNALCYSVKEFISIMMENSFEKELRLLTSSKCECSNSLCISPAASSLELFNELPEESDTLEYKECATADPVTLAVEELRDYSIAWLNSGKEGKLRIGVSDKPPLATGVWLHDETQLRLVKSLEARFGGSLDREKFCFPSLTEYFNITKCQLSADSSRLLSQSTNVLIIWLKASKNCDEGFDYIRRQLYKQWMEKKNGALEDLFSGRKSILLPLDVSLLPNAQSISKENIALFPVAISHGLPLPLSKKGRKRMGDVVKGLTTLIDKDKSISQYIHSYEFVDLTTSKNVIHQDYCILDIDVVPPPTANKEMEFEDIVLHCSNFADQHRNGQFTDLLQPFDRPILITDCLNDQDCVKGFAHIPWSLIVNFDFEASSNVSATSFKSIEKPYCNNITYLSLSKDDPADLEAMSDASPVYCVHALGTSGGSTVARHALWKLKDRYCCVIPFQMYKNLKKDIEQLSETSKNCVVVLWDTNLGIDFDTLKSMLKDIDVVFLCVERAFNPSGCQADVKIPENLTIAQLQEFCCQLSSNRNFNPKALKSLMICEERDKKGVPVFLVMLTGLETREFIQLPEYVNDRLTGLSDEQKKIMLQVAFAQLYTGKPLEMRAVETNDEQWQDTLPSSVQDLIRFGNHHGTYTFVHMRHHLIDELVIAKIEGIVKDSEKWGEWMASFVVPFIDHLRKEYPINPNTEGLINEFERVLRMLFHDKSSSMSIPDFVAKIKNKFYAIACMQKVRQKLPKLRVDRIRAHFLGDLARVYLIMDKENDLPHSKKNYEGSTQSTSQRKYTASSNGSTILQQYETN